MTDVPPDNVALLEEGVRLDVHVVAAPISILSYFNAKKGPSTTSRSGRRWPTRWTGPESTRSSTPAPPASARARPDRRWRGTTPTPRSTAVPRRRQGQGAAGRGRRRGGGVHPDGELLVQGTHQRRPGAGRGLEAGRHRPASSTSSTAAPGSPAGWPGDYQMAMSSLLHRRQRRQDRLPAVQHVRLDERDELTATPTPRSTSCSARPGRPARTRSAPPPASRPTPCSPPTPSRCRRSTRA